MFRLTAKHILNSKIETIIVQVFLEPNIYIKKVFQKSI